MAELSFETLDTLVRRIADGDPEAEEQLLRMTNLHARVAMMVQRRVNRGGEAAREIVSEVILSVLVSLRAGHYQPARGTLWSYVWGIARNKVRDWLRAEKRERRRLELNPEMPDLSEHPVERRARHQALRECMRSLDPKYRMVLLLRYYEDQSIPLIAEQLGLSERQVYNRIHYALRLIREQLNNS